MAEMQVCHTTASFLPWFQELLQETPPFRIPNWNTDTSFQIMYNSLTFLREHIPSFPQMSSSFFSLMMYL